MNTLEIILLIIYELATLLNVILSYTTIILYYIYCCIKKLRFFFENAFDEYHYIKVIIAFVIVKIYCFVWKYTEIYIVSLKNIHKEHKKYVWIIFHYVQEIIQCG